MNQSARCTLRRAGKDDVGLILELITDLARYERLEHQVVASKADLERTLFGAKPCAEVLIAEAGQQPAGFALYFQNYSTFLARPGIYLEDLFVKPQFRGQGIGLELLRELARIAIGRKCARLDWMVLDWNSQAIAFYEQIGASRTDAFCPYRLEGEALQLLAQGGKTGGQSDV